MKTFILKSASGEEIHRFRAVDEAAATEEAKKYCWQGGSVSIWDDTGVMLVDHRILAGWIRWEEGR